MSASAGMSFRFVALLGTLGLLAAGIPLVVQHWTIGQLRQQNAELRQALEREDPVNEAGRAVAAMDPEEVERLRTQAAEVHRLRAEIAEARRELAARQVEVDRLRAVEKGLRGQLSRQSGQRKAAEDRAAREEERRMIARKQDERKRLGLAIHRMAAQGAGSLEALGKAAGLTEQQLAELKAGSIFFTHKSMEVRTPDGGFRILVADREPTQTLDGRALWFFTMTDGSVITSRRPPSADGIFRPQAGEPLEAQVSPGIPGKPPQ